LKNILTVDRFIISERMYLNRSTHLMHAKLRKRKVSHRIAITFCQALWNTPG